MERALEGGSCTVGSVKGNVGHLDAAAGMAGLLKTVLALQHETLPATLNHRQPNPDINVTTSPLRIQNQTTPWPRAHRPRRAGISAFGFGGTNAHLILEEAPTPPPPTPSPRQTETLILSARTQHALEQATDQLAHHLQTHRPHLADTAYTLAHGRHAFPHRRIVTGTDLDTITHALQTRDPAHLTTTHTPHDTPTTVFLFSGQGTQYPGMAHDLYHTHKTFRETVDECATHLTPHLNADIRTILWHTNHTPHPLAQTQYAQPALFTIEYALARQWQHWGIHPTTLIGHSLGEWVAACLAGIFTLPDALALVTLRGRLMQNQPPGTMLNVMTDRATIEKNLPPQLALAAHNGPRDCVISGPHHAIEEFTHHAQQHGWPTQTLTTDHAFHSPLMDPVLDTFATAIERVERNTPHTTIISNTTGQPLTHHQAQNPHYWAQHIRSTVEFTTSITTANQHPTTHYLEIGPGHTLTALTRRIPTTHTEKPTTHTTLPHPHNPTTPTQHIHNTLHHLWLTGHTPNWNTYYQHENRHRIPLPTHPLNPKHHWLHKPTPQQTPTTHT
ncbi:acyltransferase domain-containing protein, partial [Streptomyces sp. NPDC017248]|uniref:acyltransferase domain-containing protein n=1 Tax=unclassified Streptomyces TaxID=2593676 RepID=UPI00379C9A89